MALIVTQPTGLSTKEAAARLHRSPLTARNQLDNTMRKFGASNHFELAV